MHPLAQIALGTLVAAAAAACSNETTPPEAAATGRVEASRVPGGVAIVNGTDRGIAYVAYDPQWLGLLAACADPGPACVRLPARQRVVVPEREFAGWDGRADLARKLTVRWWRVEAAPRGGYTAVDVHEIPVIE